MPSTGAPGNVWYPDNTAPVSPLEGLFSQGAVSVNVALAAFQQALPYLTPDQATRDARFPSPVQGNSVFRQDLGYTETYFAAYNASTNVGGVLTPGWYPEAGTLLGSSWQNSSYTSTTSAAAIPGLSATAYTPNIPVLLKMNLVVANGNSGADRLLTVQFFEDAVAVGTARAYLVSFSGALTPYTSIAHTVQRTPTAGVHVYTVKVTASAASAVIVSETSIEVEALAPKA